MNQENSKKKFTDIDFAMMNRALEEAKKAVTHGDVPVGAVIVQNQTEKILAACHNTREIQGNVLGHAELSALNEACHALGSWRLTDCTLYVTLEPCPMCTGAIINSRISTVVFGAYDLRAGCMDSVIDLCNYPFESRPEIYGGIYEDECAEILSDFFKAVRNEKQNS